MAGYIRSLFKRKNVATQLEIPFAMHNLQVHRRKVKYARIMVHHDGQIHFIAPMRLSEQRIAELLDKHATWIDKQRERFSRLARIELKADEVLYRGKCYKVHYRASLGDEVFVDHEALSISCGRNLLDPQIAEQWYKKEAQRVLPRRVEVMAERFGFHYTQVRVRSPKTIWGSCSSRHALSFNWRLIKAPPFVLDYLVLHELSHTRVADHSTRFWNQVEEVCPRYKEAVEWLKTYGRWI